MTELQLIDDAIVTGALRDFYALGHKRPRTAASCRSGSGSGSGRCQEEEGNDKLANSLGLERKAAAHLARHDLSFALLETASLSLHHVAHVSLQVKLLQEHQKPSALTRKDPRIEAHLQHLAHHAMKRPEAARPILDVVSHALNRAEAAAWLLEMSVHQLRRAVTAEGALATGSGVGESPHAAHAAAAVQQSITSLLKRCDAGVIKSVTNRFAEQDQCPPSWDTQDAKSLGGSTNAGLPGDVEENDVDTDVKAFGHHFQCEMGTGVGSSQEEGWWRQHQLPSWIAIPMPVKVGVFEEARAVSICERLQVLFDALDAEDVSSTPTIDVNGVSWTELFAVTCLKGLRTACCNSNETLHKSSWDFGGKGGSGEAYAHVEPLTSLMEKELHPRTRAESDHRAVTLALALWFSMAVKRLVLRAWQRGPTCSTDERERAKSTMNEWDDFFTSIAGSMSNDPCAAKVVCAALATLRRSQVEFQSSA